MKKLRLVLAGLSLAALAVVGHSSVKSTPVSTQAASCCTGGACCDGGACCGK